MSGREDVHERREIPDRRLRRSQTNEIDDDALLYRSYCLVGLDLNLITLFVFIHEPNEPPRRVKTRHRVVY